MALDPTTARTVCQAATQNAVVAEWTRKEFISLAAQVAPAVVAAIATIWAAMSAARSAKASKETIDTMVSLHNDQQKYNIPIFEIRSIEAIKEITKETDEKGYDFRYSKLNKIIITLKNKKEIDIKYVKGIWVMLDQKNDFISCRYFHCPTELNPSPEISIGIFDDPSTVKCIANFTKTNNGKDHFEFNVFLHIEAEDMFHNKNSSAHAFNLSINDPFQENEELPNVVPENSVIIVGAALHVLSRSGLKIAIPAKKYATEMDLYTRYSISNYLAGN